MHAVGVIDDAAVKYFSWEKFENVMRPKINGAINLHKYTMDT